MSGAREDAGTGPAAASPVRSPTMADVGGRDGRHRRLRRTQAHGVAEIGRGGGRRVLGAPDDRPRRRRRARARRRRSWWPAPRSYRGRGDGYVLPSHRGRGIGTALVEWWTARAGEHGQRARRPDRQRRRRERRRAAAGPRLHRAAIPRGSSQYPLGDEPPAPAARRSASRSACCSPARSARSST